MITDPHGPGFVFYAKDCAALARFYATVLDLPVAQEEDGFVRLASDRFELVVVQAPAAIAAAIRIADPPQPRSETPIKPSFFVADVRALRLTILASGGFLKPDETAWSWNGAVHLDGWDPEGNVFQLRQRDA